MNMNTTKTPAQRHKKRRIVLIVLVTLIAIRVALPYVLLHFANKRLATMPDHYGHIADIDLAIYRGAYQIEGFFLDRKDSATQERVPFIAASLIDLSVEWASLFDGAIVGELEIAEPMLRFTKDKTEPQEVQGDTASLGDLLKDFMPLNINRLTLHKGRIEYVDEGSTPPLHLALTDVEAVARNLSSVVDEEVVLPSTVIASAQLYGGDLRMNMGINALNKETTFDLDLKLEGMVLTELNDFFSAYADFDVNKGTMSLYTELATRDGAFEGYLKPIIKDLDVLGKEDKHDNLLRKLWEGIVGSAGAVLKNPREKQFGTKIPLSGRLDDPKVRTWVALIQVLRNAFIRALEPALDREVNIEAVGQEAEESKGFLKDLFSKDDKKETRGKKGK